MGKSALLHEHGFIWGSETHHIITAGAPVHAGRGSEAKTRTELCKSYIKTDNALLISSTSVGLFQKIILHNHYARLMLIMWLLRQMPLLSKTKLYE